MHEYRVNEFKIFIVQLNSKGLNLKCTVPAPALALNVCHTGIISVCTTTAYTIDTAYIWIYLIGAVVFEM
jgi:hypothetical protein